MSAKHHATNHTHTPDFWDERPAKYRAKVLHRPVGGWGARRWRREVAAWLWLAFLFLCAGAACSTLFSLIDFVLIELVGGQ